MERMLVAVCVLFAGCGGTPAPPPTHSVSRASPTPSVERADTESEGETLRTALVGLRPRVELISQTCALDPAETLVWEDRLCVLDADGRVRAWRRVALGGRVFAAQADELVVFVVESSDFPTRFARRWWRWDLRDDRLEALPFEPNGEIPRETSFGVLLVPRDGANVRVVTHDSVEELRGWEGFGPNQLWRVGNETFVWAGDSIERVVARDGELAREPFARFGSGVRERRILTPVTFVAWVEDRSGTSVQFNGSVA